jgi:hypothetical protein
LPWGPAPDWDAQYRDREEFVAWRNSLATNVGNAILDGYGCLLLLCSFGTLLGGAYLTYLALDSSGAVVSGGRGTALCLAVPSILAAIGVFYLLAPVFYRLRKRSGKSGL